MNGDTDTPGQQWAKRASAWLVQKKWWNTARHQAVIRIGKCIDNGELAKSSHVLDLFGRDDVAAQTMKMFWDAGLLKRKKLAGRYWGYYCEEHPPEFLKSLL